MRTTPPSRCASALFCVLALSSACAYEFEDLERRPHGTVGAEVFRVVCMNLAAQAFPNDLSGELFSAECDGGSPGNDEVAKAKSTELPAPEDAREKRAYLRQRALIAQRPRLVRALDAVFEETAYRKDELRTFLAEMVPLYEAPEVLPELTRAASKLLLELIDPNDARGAEAIAALERMSAREGYRPARFDLGLTRPMLAYPEMDEVVRTVLAAVDIDDGPAKTEFEELLRAAALDLATADKSTPNPEDPGTLAVSLKLLFSEHEAFAGDGLPLYLTRRDVRGVALPKGADAGVRPPFKDDDSDCLADLDGRGRFVLAAGPYVPPYRAFGSSEAKGAREPLGGRALAEDGSPLYEAVDVNRTLLAGVLRDLAALLTANGDKPAALLDFAYGLNAVLGDYGSRSHAFDKAKLNYQGPDTSSGPLFDLIHAFSSVLPFEQTDAFLEITGKLVETYPSELAGLVEAILYIKERADAHPEAAWDKPHEFWDDLIAWATRVAQNDGLMEALLRATSHEDTAALGPLLGNFMRFKDPVNYVLGSREEMKALGIDPPSVIGNLDKPCSGPRCGQPCDLSNSCGDGAACVIARRDDPTGAGTCGAIWQAVKAHRMNVNSPCENPPTSMMAMITGGAAGKVSDPACVPQAPYPAKHHRGIRGCPAEKPQHGASCADAGGLGLCSWDEGSCTCACANGLCRNAAQPVWSCTNEPTRGYTEWVDRTRPDVRKGEDGRSNQSLFQRTLGLIHDLHIPTVMCNKAGARVSLKDVAGEPEEILGGIGTQILTGIDSSLLGPFAECQMLKEDRIIRYYLRATLGYGGVKIQDDGLNQVMGILGALSDPIMESQYQIRGFNLASPTPQGIGRMVFSPQNPFQDGLTGLVQSRDKKVLMDLHYDTIMSWEVPDPIGKKSYLEALVPMLEALDPNKDADDGFIDLYADVFSILHKHWSSKQTDSTRRVCDDAMPPNCDETADFFAYQSNGVSYEELAAEAFLDAQIVERISGLLRVLGTLKTDDGKYDGIQIFAEAVMNLLIPERSCPGGDCSGQPLAYRDGKSSTSSNTGKPIESVAPIYLVLDALNAIDARFEGALAERLAPWRAARSKLVDVFFDVTSSAPGEWQFKNPRGPALLVSVVNFAREQVARYRAKQQQCLDAGGSIDDCQQVRDWALGLTERLEASLAQPVAAATLRLLDRLRELDTDPAGKTAKFMSYLMSEKAGSDAFAGTLMATADTVQVLQDTRNLGPLMSFIARAIAPNVYDVADGKAGDVDIQAGSVQKSITLMRSLQNIAPESDSEASTLAKLLARLAKPFDEEGATPLDVIIDSVVAVNRAVPGEAEEVPLEQQDLRSLLSETEQFLSSERHGLERLYDVIQSRNVP